MDYPLSCFSDVLMGYLTKTEDYQAERDKSVAKQISSIPGITLVIFGAGHPEIADRVAADRDIEIHFPYKDYKTSYDSQLRQLFRKTGKADVELFMRDLMDGLARAAIRRMSENGLTERELDSIADYYASTLKQDQIIAYVQYVNFASKIGMRGQDSGHIFESWLKRESLPLPKEIKK